MLWDIWKALPQEERKQQLILGVWECKQGLDAIRLLEWVSKIQSIFWNEVVVVWRYKKRGNYMY